MKMTKKALLTGAALSLLLAGGAIAANVHLKKGPAFNDGGLVLTAKTSLAGLGNADIVVNLTAVAQPLVSCTNPAGVTQPPGQNPAEATVTGSVAIPKGAIKNGNVTVTVTTAPPVLTVDGAPDCPNPQWTEALEDLSFKSATLRVEQPAGVSVLTVKCTFTPSTVDGVVPSGTVYCS